ncbi:hypothetical protein REPUB_Repub06bG0110200 [Reevesia pubescens]
MTTRSMSVAKICKKSSLIHVHNLEPLPLEMAQELLCRTAFQCDQQKQCPAELKDLSFDIVKNYLNLPRHLKSSFLYLGMFPRNHSIRSKRLIRLWIVVDLVKEKQVRTLEEIGEEHLTMFVHRSLVQVEWRDSTGRVRTFRVHDLMHELVRSKSEEINLIQSSQGHLTITNGKARHLSIDNGACDLSRSNGNFQTHSIIFFNLREFPKSLFTRLPLNYKFLREIDFERAQLEYVPEELGNLLHLGYLSLRDTKVKILPKYIGKLHNLQTLDLKRSLVHEIPIEISNLRDLQYLVAYFVDYDNRYRRLKRLRKLGINKLTSDCGMDLCDAIEHMHRLQSLYISAVKDMMNFFNYNQCSSPPLFLQCLRLQGRSSKLPDWVSKLKNLVKISLNWSRVSDDSLKILGGLPNLLEFWVHEADDDYGKNDVLVVLMEENDSLRKSRAATTGFNDLIRQMKPK